MTSKNNILTCFDAELNTVFDCIKSLRLETDVPSFVRRPLYVCHHTIEYCDFHRSLFHLFSVDGESHDCYKIETGNMLDMGSDNTNIENALNIHDCILSQYFFKNKVYGMCTYRGKVSSLRSYFVQKCAKIQSYCDFDPNILDSHEGYLYTLMPADVLLRIISDGNIVPEETRKLFKEILEKNNLTANENDNFFLLKFKAKDET